MMSHTMWEREWARELMFTRPFAKVASTTMELDGYACQ